jgi:hypothetical protein
MIVMPPVDNIAHRYYRKTREGIAEIRNKVDEMLIMQQMIDASLQGLNTAVLTQTAAINRRGSELDAQVVKLESDELRSENDDETRSPNRWLISPRIVAATRQRAEASL